MLRDRDVGGAVVQVATPASLERYYESFKLLRQENPEVWHACGKAEDRCRAEHFPRLKRLLEKEKGAEVTGWSEVFSVASADDRGSSTSPSVHRQGWQIAPGHPST